MRQVDDELRRLQEMKANHRFADPKARKQHSASIRHRDGLERERASLGASSIARWSPKMYASAA
jgi:hypothetical protein